MAFLMKDAPEPLRLSTRACMNIKFNGMSEDAMKLCRELTESSIRTWDKVRDIFLAWSFPPNQQTKLLSEIFVSDTTKLAWYLIS